MTNYLFVGNTCLLDKEEDYNKAYQSISKERKEKVDKLKFIKDKKLSILAEVILKKALDSLNIKSELLYKYNEYKKPYLKDNSIYFNISHSGEFVIVVLSNDEVGCDIEQVTDIDIKIAEKFFCNNEYQDIMKSNNKIDTFYRYWTLKESFMKACGLGFNIDLKSFEISLQDDISIKHNLNNNEYYFKEINIPRYKASVCLLNDNILVVNNIESL